MLVGIVRSLRLSWRMNASAAKGNHPATSAFSGKRRCRSAHCGEAGRFGLRFQKDVPTGLVPNRGWYSIRRQLNDSCPIQPGRALCERVHWRRSKGKERTKQPDDIAIIAFRKNNCNVSFSPASWTREKRLQYQPRVRPSLLPGRQHLKNILVLVPELGCRDTGNRARTIAVTSQPIAKTRKRDGQCQRDQAEGPRRDRFCSGAGRLM